MKTNEIIESISTNETALEVWNTFESICSLKLKNPLLIWISGFSIGAVSGFVEQWIISPSATYFALIGLIIFDHITGVSLAFKNNRFETRKALRIIWTLLSHTALLLLSNQLSKGSASLFWLNEAVFVPLVLVNLLSLVKNLSLLGFIKKGFTEFFYKKIDAYKNDFVKKEDEK